MLKRFTKYSFIYHQRNNSKVEEIVGSDDNQSGRWPRANHIEGSAREAAHEQEGEAADRQRLERACRSNNPPGSAKACHRQHGYFGPRNPQTVKIGFLGF